MLAQTAGRWSRSLLRGELCSSSASASCWASSLLASSQVSQATAPVCAQVQGVHCAQGPCSSSSTHAQGIASDQSHAPAPASSTPSQPNHQAPCTWPLPLGLRRMMHTSTHTPFRASCQLSASDSSASLGELESRLSALEGRLAALEAGEGARAKVHELARWVDAAREQPELVTQEELLRLFTPAAVVEFTDAEGRQYCAEGVDELLPFMRRLLAGLKFSRHHVANLALDVKDDASRVTARYNTLVAATVRAGTGATGGGAALFAKDTPGWALEAVTARLQRGYDDNRWRIRALSWGPGTLFTRYAGPGWDAEPHVLLAPAQAPGQQAHAQQAQKGQEAAGAGGAGAVSAVGAGKVGRK